MKLSIYTFVKNGLFQDYHVVDMLKHHLPLADEIIVNEGYSTDGTYEAIKDLSPKIKIFRKEWGECKEENWFVRFKDDSRQKCTGDWCILMDCDEFIPEWEFDRIRKYIETTDEVMAPFKLINFYANYQVYHQDPEKVCWPAKKMLLHKNLPEMEVWGDGSNIRMKGTELDWSASKEEFLIHHFGFVRNPARLRQKWTMQGDMYSGKKRWFKIPSFVYSWLPHKWDDPQFMSDLALYEGKQTETVQNNPGEFTRDKNRLTKLLQSKESSG